MEKKVYTAIGLMSGTSLDGVDCALIETDGQGYVKPMGFVSIPYTPQDREKTRICFGATMRDSDLVKAAEKIITQRHIEGVKALMDEMNLSASDIDVIGFHGQTIYHAPHDGLTIQIGDGAVMARALGIDVVDDFRTADVEAGGEGAPLAPIYHAARIQSEQIQTPCVVLNIGGVANVTWIGEGAGNIMAFDTGPGNAMMDDWIKSKTGQPYDKDGAFAQKGLVDTKLLEEWLLHPYFSRVPPKSLDRDEWDIAELGGFAKMMKSLSVEDGAATLLAFTVSAILKAVEFMPSSPKTWYACGGGRHNKALMNALNLRLGGCVKSVDDLGWNGDATEGECFAYLAVRSVLGLPISFPKTTGVPQPMSGGVLNKHDNH